MRTRALSVHKKSLCRVGFIGIVIGRIWLLPLNVLHFGWRICSVLLSSLPSGPGVRYPFRMVIGFLQASLSIPEARSLKDKRMVLRSLKDRARNKMNISVAEIDKQDKWQAAEIAFVTIAAEKKVVDKLRHTLERSREHLG